MDHPGQNWIFHPFNKNEVSPPPEWSPVPHVSCHGRHGHLHLCLLVCNGRWGPLRVSKTRVVCCRTGTQLFTICVFLIPRKSIIMPVKSCALLWRYCLRCKIRNASTSRVESCFELLFCFNSCHPHLKRQLWSDRTILATSLFNESLLVAALERRRTFGPVIEIIER